jgi:ribosomal protein L30E
MVEFMHVKVVIVASNYFALTSDEITTIDNVSWISVHAYMIVD